MASQQPPKPGLPNPYKGLPNPYAAVASGAPVRYTEEQAKAQQEKKAHAFHNPHNIKRPQAKKAGATVKKPTMPVVSTTSAMTAAPAVKTQQHGIEYYRSTADDDAAVIEERRQRNYEDRQRKKEQKKFNKLFGWWNPQAPFKADRPTNLKAYRASGGYQRKKEGFAEFLQYAAAQSKFRDGGDSADSRPASLAGSKQPPLALSMPRSGSADSISQPASPANNKGPKKFFPPPAAYDYTAQPMSSTSSGSSSSRPASSSSNKGPSFATNQFHAPPASYNHPAIRPTDESGNDAYARRMLLSQQQQYSVAPPPPHTTQSSAPPPPPPEVNELPSNPPPAFTSNVNPTAFIAHNSATISAPPVRYVQLQNKRPNVQTQDVDRESASNQHSAKRPKLSKAEAMMAKMGYKKGQGLGKNSDGVVSHLEVKMRKVPQGASLLDDDGSGGKVKSQQVWDVRGGERVQKDEPGKFGEESCVVVTWGCVEGVDWDANADRDDGGIRQEMGEAFTTKFGPVEHVQLDESNSEGVVYIHFKSILSALNAVNRFDEGWEFRGRKIRAKYYDERKFHAGIFDH